MSAAELRAAIAALGLTQQQAASRLGVNERTFRRWVAGGSRIPAAVGELVRMWVVRAAVA
jgi:transcriptional regulator with XRE-family HTH domain